MLCVLHQIAVSYIVVVGNFAFAVPNISYNDTGYTIERAAS
jgi:hypothetical protein